MLPKLIRTRLSHVILHITARCNLKCKTCFVPNENRDLSLTDARIIAAKLGRITWLDIGGGEPFLHSDLVAICHLFRTRSITIPTNGYLPQRICDTVQELRSAVRTKLTIAVSLDGFAEANDDLRGRGTYHRAMETLRLLQDLPGVTVKVNTVVCNRNADQLLDFVKFVRTLGPAYHTLLLVRGKPASPEIHLPDLHTLRRQTDAILDVLKTYGYAESRNLLLRSLKRNYQRYLWKVSLDTLEKQRCLIPCKAPYLHKVIYPDGRVAMCELTPPVGNILTDSVNDIEARMRDKLRQYEQERGPCFCTHNCNMGENIMAHPRSVMNVVLGRSNG